MSNVLVDSYRFVSIPASLAISGSHAYNFGGTSVDDSVYGDMITEQELGTATTSIEKADIVDINTRGANAQTSTINLALAGTGTGGVQILMSYRNIQSVAHQMLRIRQILIKHQIRVGLSVTVRLTHTH